MKVGLRSAALNGMASLLVIVWAGTVCAQDASVPVTNAVLEGIQLSSQAGGEPSEKVVTGYFIFRDRFSTFFYEVKPQSKTMVFEFHDVEKGTTPVESTAEDPILGFTVEQRKVDVNKEVTGLNPEWHDVVTVTFNLRQVPIVTVNDEYNVVSFSFKWSTDASKLGQYTMKEKKVNPWLWGGIGGGVLVAGGVAAYYIITSLNPVVEAGPLDISDLPQHPDK